MLTLFCLILEDPYPLNKSSYTSVINKITIVIIKKIVEIMHDKKSPPPVPRSPGN